MILIAAALLIIACVWSIAEAVIERDWPRETLPWVAIFAVILIGFVAH